MSKSASAKAMSGLLKFWPKKTAEESEKTLSEMLEKGEKPTAPPKNIVTRYEDLLNDLVDVSEKIADKLQTVI